MPTGIGSGVGLPYIRPGAGGGGGYSPATAFGADLFRWIDANNAGSFTLSGSDIVSVADLSGNAGVYTQNGTTPFTREADAANANKPGINCGAGSANAYLADAAAILAQPFTHLVAARAVTTTTAQAIIDSSGSDSALYVLSDTWRIYAGTTEVVGGAADAAAVLLEAFLFGTNSYLSVDGAAAVVGTAGNNGLIGMTVGSNRAHNGKFSGFIYEIITVSREVTPAELTAALAYLAAKWQ